MKSNQLSDKKTLVPPAKKSKRTPIGQHKGLVIVITGNGKGKTDISFRSGTARHWPGI